MLLLLFHGPLAAPPLRDAVNLHLFLGSPPANNDDQKYETKKRRPLPGVERLLPATRSGRWTSRTTVPVQAVLPLRRERGGRKAATAGAAGA